MNPEVCLGGLWIAWLLVWLVAAAFTARTIAHQSGLSRLAHSLPVWAGAVLLLSHDRSSGSLFRALLPPRAWIAWLGVVVTALGLGFAGWARAHLGRFWSGTVTLKAEHAIVRTGPYALTRHPIYTGLFVALAGTALTRDTIAGALGAALILLGFLFKIGQEERLLIGHFGAAYRTYQEEVPRLIPRLPLPGRAPRE